MIADDCKPPGGCSDSYCGDCAASLWLDNVKPTFFHLQNLLESGPLILDEYLDSVSSGW